MSSPRTAPTSFPSSGKKVGFIGLGNMGLPMAINLARADVPVVAFDANSEARIAAAAQAAGITMAASSAEIGADDDCHVIFTMLPGCAAVDSVMDTLLRSSGETTKSRVLVDCSTVSPSTSRRWHQTWSDENNDNDEGLYYDMLDAPVSGGVKGATDGTLTFMVGCQNPRALSTARPYLEIMGQRVMECGGAGAGAVAKLCNNLALACQMIGICEAMNLGEALDVDPVVLSDVMNQSTAKCWSGEVNNPHPAVAMHRAAATAAAGGSAGASPAARDYQGGFGTDLMLKDLSLAVQVAQEVDLAMPLTTTSKELYRLAHLRGMGQQDFGVMLQFLRGK